MAKTFLELIEQVKGILNVANGGTGKATLGSGKLITGNGTSPVGEITPGANGDVLQVVAGAWVSGAPTAGLSEELAIAYAIAL